MALQATININVDFHDNKYITLNAKQYDTNSRLIAITCYNQGDIYTLSSSKHSAYIKYRKPDGYSVFSFCKINYKGEVIVELTQQMLAVGGICYAELVVINKGDAQVNVTTGEIIAINNPPIFSTMAFCVNVYETVVDNTLIESADSFDGLNSLLQRAEAEYQEVVLSSKSYAHGNTGVRDGENTDNAKYYYEQSRANVNKIKASEENALNSMNLAESYAHGNTGVRDGENTDNAKYYCEVVKSVVDGVNSGFIPIGTISFSELATAQKATGFTYNISDDFITDDTFAEGAGKSYTAGSNVYCRSDGLWDCFGGSASATATVNEVKSYLGIE